MKPPIILTGFEAFGDHAFNPSGVFSMAAATALRAGHFDAHHSILPVTWETAARAPLELAPRDAILIHCGLAAGRLGIHLERGASNLAGDTPDNDGVVVAGPLDQGGPARLTTSLDLRRLKMLLWDEFRRANTETWLHAFLSDDAGDYICNAIYYRALQARPAGALFVHIQQMSSSDAARAGRAFARALALILPPGHTASV